MIGGQEKNSGVSEEDDVMGEMGLVSFTFESKLNLISIGAVGLRERELDVNFSSEMQKHLSPMLLNSPLFFRSIEFHLFH